MKTPSGSLLTWLKWALKQETDSCVLWPFAVDKDGYPVWTQGERPHRYICKETHGSCPDGMEARHSCNNRACCNKRHLSWSTHLDNLGDRNLFETVAKGEKHGRAKLTEIEVLEIRKKLSGGATQKHLAAEFNVSAGLIFRIKERKIWTHI